MKIEHELNKHNFLFRKDPEYQNRNLLQRKFVLTFLFSVICVSASLYWEEPMSL